MLKHFKGGPPRSRDIKLSRPSAAVYCLLFLSLLITFIYFQAVGYNTFALGLRNIFTGGTADYTTLRLESYGGSRYLFPGYVNQFKNSVLPALTVVMTIYVYKVRHPRRNLIAPPLIAASIFGILGTGQRGAFIQFGLTLIVFLFFVNRSRFIVRATVSALALAPLLLLSTLFLGRSSSSLSQSPGILSTVGTLGSELVRRVFHDNQFSGAMGFRYIYVQQVRNGEEWVDAILGVLPGHPGSPLARQLFFNLYGTDRGTAPASLWGSVFLNFGWHGVIAVPVALAIIYQIITFRATSKTSLNTLELIGMSGTFVVFGNWAAGGPEYVLNAGGVTFALIWWYGRRAGYTSEANGAVDRASSWTRKRRDSVTASDYERLQSASAHSERRQV